MNIVEMIEKEQMRGDIPGFKTGDTVKVYVRIIEGQKQRIQAFEGVVIRKRQGNSRANFTVRKVSYGVGVERVFPIHSPNVAGVEVTRHGSVRRAKLFYLRDRVGKASKVKEKI